MAKADFHIVPLSARAEFADVCAAWSFGEWSCQTGRITLEQARTRYRLTATDPSVMPATWICVDRDKPAGMISLKKDDHPDRPDLTPWLASVFVHASHRGKGIASALIERLEREARETFGFDRLHLFTETPEGLYLKHGYRRIGTERDPSGLNPRGETLMKKDLTNV